MEILMVPYPLNKMLLPEMFRVCHIYLSIVGYHLDNVQYPQLLIRNIILLLCLIIIPYIMGYG